MSYSADRQWQIEREQRRQLHLERIRKVTAEYAARNRERIDSLVNQGLDAFVSEEISHCKAMLDEVENNLSRDPERARDVNIRLSNALKPLFSRARSNRHKHQVAQRESENRAREMARLDAIQKLKTERDERSKEASELLSLQQALDNSLTSFLNSLPDMPTRDFAYDSIQSFRAEISADDMTADKLIYFKSQLEQCLPSVRNEAIQKADAWKKGNESVDVADNIKLSLVENIKTYKNLKDNNTVDEITKLQARFEGGYVDEAEINEQLSQIQTAAEKRSESETERAHMVNAICQSLRSTGFTVEKPRFDKSGSGDVVVRAKRASGVEAAFKVQLDGGLIYKFDRYRGQACLEDANEVLPKLEEIYNIDLSKENVNWRNPDLNFASARQIPESAQEDKK